MSNRLRLLPELVSARLPEHGDAIALEFAGSVTTYAELAHDIELIARRIAAVGEPGDRIAVLAWNRREYVTLLYAVPAAGRVLVPLNARLAPAELHAQLYRSGVRLLFGDPGLIDGLVAHSAGSPQLEIVSFDRDFEDWRSQNSCSSLPALDSLQAAWLLFTSGTTGQPKGAVLTHASLLAGLVSAEYGRPVEPDDRYLYPFPLFHVSAHNVLLQHKHGATVVLHAGFDAGRVLGALRGCGITTLSLAPTMLALLLEHPEFTDEHFSGVRTIGYGAAAMPVAVLQQLLKPGGPDFSGGYGMTELSGSVSFLDAQGHRAALAGQPHLLESVGKPVPGVEICLSVDDEGADTTASTVEMGEILIRGPQVMAGYWGDSQATADTLHDGWLHTGDIGRFDESGNLYIVDRKKDMILTGGENVASREVEEVLASHPDISRAAVVGLPDNKWGETVCALVVAAPGRELGVGQVVAHCRDYLAGYKVPRQVLIADELPVNANGKIDKQRIRGLIIAHRQRGEK